MTWTQTKKTVSAKGTDITYRCVGTNIRIESRKRHIPHANRLGTWDHTSFFVIRGDEELVEKQTLKDAKDYAERLVRE